MKVKIEIDSQELVKIGCKTGASMQRFKQDVVIINGHNAKVNATIELTSDGTLYDSLCLKSTRNNIILATVKERKDGLVFDCLSDLFAPHLTVWRNAVTEGFEGTQ